MHTKPRLLTAMLYCPLLCGQTTLVAHPSAQVWANYSPWDKLSLWLVGVNKVLLEHHPICSFVLRTRLRSR